MTVPKCRDSATPKRGAPPVLLFAAMLAGLTLAPLPIDVTWADSSRKIPVTALNAASPLKEIRSGYSYMPAPLRRLQDDPALNPATLWLRHGADLWRTRPANGNKTCKHCHNAAVVAMRGVAPRYPLFDRASGRIITLEQRINFCRTRYMGTDVLAPESDDLLALSIYVRRQSAGMAMAPKVSGHAAKVFEQGRKYFETRRGQRNLACTACHGDAAGKMYRATRLSQGQPNASPTYRSAWGRPGSLHRRFQDCNKLARAEPRPIGHPDYVALELYLSWRGAGARIETPGVRP